MDNRAWDERYAASELVWGAEPNRWVVRETAGLAPGRALDLAAGEGRNSIWLARQGWRVTGLDFSAVALDRAARLTAGLSAEVAGRLTWRQGDARTFPEPAGVYDLVVVAYLQLPADDRRAALRRAAAVLAPGGTLLVVGHDTTNLTEGVGGPQDPRVLFTPADVLADLGGAGLRTVRAERVRRPVTAESGHHRAGAAGVAGAAAGAAGPARTEAVDALVRLVRPERNT
ncbi:class I SAM-dependent methyltransferase [Kitasatospora sp. NBC_01560]|uniref:class I SAM-dependent methyltransferase n=1 Tax=Kitasatospora sp. NBC_01560 TaxID=2975965 RepID=UPI00386D2454